MAAFRTYMHVHTREPSSVFYLCLPWKYTHKRRITYLLHTYNYVNIYEYIHTHGYVHAQTATTSGVCGSHNPRYK